jgi:hypothetical protein
MAKSTDDILNDATFGNFFSFNGSSLAEDMGSNKTSVSMQNGNTVTRKVGQALSLSGTSFVFQAYAFNQLSWQVCSSPKVTSSDQKLPKSAFIRNSNVYIDDLYFDDIYFGDLIFR